MSTPREVLHRAMHDKKCSCSDWASDYHSNDYAAMADEALGYLSAAGLETP